MSDQGGVTILVTGGAGFVGQHIVKELMEQGEFPIKEIRTFDIQPFKWHHGLQPAKDSHKLYHIEGSICDPEAITKACDGVDAVIHTCSCIAYGAYPNEKAIRAVNVTGTECTVNACIENNVECLVYTSSMEVANDLKGPSINSTEKSATVPPIEPIFPIYAQSKYDAEQIVLGAQNTELKNGKIFSTCALRPCGIYGEGEHIIVEHLAIFLNSGVGFQIGEPNGKSQYAYAGNIAYSHVLAVKALLWPEENKQVGGEAFFLGDDTPLMSVGAFVGQFVEPLGSKMSTIAPPFWLMYTIAYFLTIVSWVISYFKVYDMPFHTSVVRYMYGEHHYSWEKLRNVLSYKPKYTYKEGIDRSIAFYKKYLSLKDKPNESKKQK